MTNEDIVDTLEAILADIQCEYYNSDYPDSEEVHLKKVEVILEAINYYSSI